MGRRNSVGTSAPAGTLLGVGLDEITRALRHCSRRVLLATPFMSLEVAQILIRAVDASRAVDRRLITAVNVAAVEGGYLNPDAVSAFVEADFDVRSLRNLHAKVILRDATWGLVGSGNFTAAGLNGGNAELGVVLNAAQTKKAASQFFTPWWQAAEPIDLGYLHRLASSARRPRNAERAQRKGQGGFFSTPSGTELESFAKDPRNSGYWLKIMYGNEELRRASAWKDMTWISDAHTFRNGKPSRRPSYATGDHLVAYLSQDTLKGCPAVLRVVDEPRYDPDLVAKESPGDEDRWAWVTPTEPIAAVDLARAPSLDEIGVAGRSTYQQGHIRLTPEQYRKALTRIRHGK